MFIRALSPGPHSRSSVGMMFHAKKAMMRAPGSLRIARVDEGPAVNSNRTLPMLICSRVVSSGPEASTLADEVVGAVARSQKFREILRRCTLTETRWRQWKYSKYVPDEYVCSWTPIARLMFSRAHVLSVRLTVSNRLEALFHVLRGSSKGWWNDKLHDVEWLAGERTWCEAKSDSVLISGSTGDGTCQLVSYKG